MPPGGQREKEQEPDALEKNVENHGAGKPEAQAAGNMEHGVVDSRREKQLAAARGKDRVRDVNLQAEHPQCPDRRSSGPPGKTSRQRGTGS